MEITDEGERIVMHYERFNTVRTIDMSGNPPRADRAPSELGYSAGRWEGDELIIETTHLLGGAVRNGDLPLSAEAHVTERYWREPGENDLQLRVEVRDPVNYTEPFTMGRAFIWAPDEERAALAAWNEAEGREIEATRWTELRLKPHRN